LLEKNKAELHKKAELFEYSQHSYIYHNTRQFNMCFFVKYASVGVGHLEN